MTDVGVGGSGEEKGLRAWGDMEERIWEEGI